MKKIISVVMIVALIIASTIYVSAHGHGIRKNSATRYSICTVENCIQTGLHKHNSGTYTAHYYGDGHDYHEYCNIEDCLIAGYHEHDGVYCFGHTVNDGHDYHAYCNISGCDLYGYHAHDGEYCFAHTMDDGHGHNTSGKGGYCHR